MMLSLYSYSRTQVDNFLQYLNSQAKGLQFQMELEDDRNFAYIEIQLSQIVISNSIQMTLQNRTRVWWKLSLIAISEYANQNTLKRVCKKT